jgi:hypothetical protein
MEETIVPSGTPRGQPARARLSETRQKKALPACVLGWLVPGAGHVLLGRPVRGAVFCFCLVTMFALGVAMDTRLSVYVGLEDPLALVISAGQMAAGLPYFAARGLGYSAGEVRSPSFEYGVTFSAVAGLLNVLVILDAYDTAAGRRS